MEPTGIRRKVDDLGRIVIPAGIRRSLDITEGDELDVGVDGDRVVLSRRSDRCTFCTSAEPSMQTFQGKPVCRGCIAAVGRLDAGLRGARPPAVVTDGDGRAAAVAPAADAGDDHESASTTAW